MTSRNVEEVRVGRGGEDPRQPRFLALGDMNDEPSPRWMWRSV